MKKLFLLVVLVSGVFGAEPVSWDKIDAVVKYSADEVAEPSLAKYLCLPEEIEYIVEYADSQYLVRPLNGDVAIFYANTSEEAALLAYCELYNSGEPSPETFEVKGPVK